eukprot:g15234.t1
MNHSQIKKTAEEERRQALEEFKNRKLFEERQQSVAENYTEEDAFLDELLEHMPRSFHMFYGDAAAYIFKSPHLSRGRGLKVMTCRGKLRPMLEEAYVILSLYSRSALNQRWFCIVQKYLEKPFLVDYRGECVKCDLRLWVSALNWNPVVALVHHRPYFRFATKPFGFSRWRQDQRAHLTNRTIQEPDGSTDPDVKCSEEDDPDYQLVYDDFMNYLKKNYGPSWVERWNKFTWPLMMDAASTTRVFSTSNYHYTKKAALKLEKVGRQLQNGPNAFELYGVDFSLDYELRPWLLEANVSPDLLGHSGPTLKQQSRDDLDELLTIVLKEPKSVPVFGFGTNGLPQGCLPEGIARQKVCCNEKDCFTHYGVTQVPPSLVCGHQIGEKKWSLFLKGPRYEPHELAEQFSRRKASEWSKRAPYASVSNGQPGHESVIRKLLLNTPFSQQAMEERGAIAKDATKGWSSNTKVGNRNSEDINAASPKSPSLRKSPWGAVKSHFRRDREKMEKMLENRMHVLDRDKMLASREKNLLSEINEIADHASSVLESSKERMAAMESKEKALHREDGDKAAAELEGEQDDHKGDSAAADENPRNAAGSPQSKVGFTRYGWTKSGRPLTSQNVMVHNNSCNIEPRPDFDVDDEANKLASGTTLTSTSWKQLRLASLRVL